jgi:hypothetical protein
MPTLRDFFFGNSSSQEIQWSELTASVRGVSWPTQESLDSLCQSALDEALNVSLLDVLIGGWKRLDTLRAACRRTRQDQTKAENVSLANHSLKSEHTPQIEIFVNDAKVHTIKFNATINLEVDGFIVSAKNGRLISMRTGKCTGKGTLKCRDITILERELVSIIFPGFISLGEGIELT